MDESTTTPLLSTEDTIINMVNIATTSGTSEESNGSLLWLPYFFLSLFLIGLCLLSFWKYHQRNKDKSPAKPVFVDDNITPGNKFKVTMKNNGSMPSSIDLLDIVSQDMPHSISTDTSNLTNYASIRNLSQRRQSGFEMLRRTKDERRLSSFDDADLKTLDARHKKTDLKVFVVAIPKEGWAHVAAPILLLV